MSRPWFATAIIACVVALSGCAPAPTAHPWVTTQPDSPGAEPLAAATTQPANPGGPSIGAPIDLKRGDDIGADVGHSNETPGVVIALPSSQPDKKPADSLLPVGLPDNVKPEFTMPGRGVAPVAGNAAAKKRAAMQAAMVVAIYNVTKEINEHSYRDDIEHGYISSDHFRYRDGTKDGLEVKSQTVIVDSKVKQFDIWLIVPAGAAGQERFQVQVRNFTLVGEPLSREKIDRVLAASGNHLAITSAACPEENGTCTVEVGLVRTPK
ncbi:MAG: hypothetical protein PHU85_15430 [Phycisphaerae bacterium]|nr:hypothetical protein [Phycisphaerae bacterium]